MERIVTRSELLADRSVASSSPEPELIEKAKTLGDFEYIARNDAQDIHTGHGSIEDDELDFRLFSTPAVTKDSEAKQIVSKISLRSPEPVNVNPGFIQPSRNLNYYLKNPPSKLERSQYEDCAVTGAQIISQSQTPWPGNSYPWKVIHISLTKKHNSILQTSTHNIFNKFVDHSVPIKHKRLGKESRIKLRVKQATAKQRQEATQKSAEEKAEADREKRNRRNREKKIKRRARERAKKAGSGAGAGAGGEDEEEVDSSD